MSVVFSYSYGVRLKYGRYGQSYGFTLASVSVAQ